ncbi:hypothetical protein [Saccharopolyspora elongata]|uniref:hypothetical protein n=1 Tax=Saccharopolyspora elongata TaxID=2530387 RepID=UPI00140512AA|nr:hypothetical protein [Saccharopolyspora elongata]
MSRLEQVAATARAVAEFARLLRQHRDNELEVWADQAENSGVRKNCSFATTLYCDWDVVVA